MSLCDTCRRPGACCRFFTLGGSRFNGMTRLEVLAEMATAHTPPPGPGKSDMVGLPFLPLFPDRVGRWWFWCPNLGRDGRCTDYENRPHTCSSFEPASDPLCVEHPAAAACRWGFLDVPETVAA